MFGHHTPQLTAEGHERTVAVNYLGHYALTLRLMPALTAAAPARVVSVTCVRHSHAWRLDFEDWMSLAPGTWFKVRMHAMRACACPVSAACCAELAGCAHSQPGDAYNNSKVMNILFAYKLNRTCVGLLMCLCCAACALPSRG
jgi:NAD(P)-dependent dehydrogenase (short-subunit alcohol dehydrogenase family)